MIIERATFGVDDEIWSKILSGEYERIGGVVRKCANAQVVCWLREVGDPSIAINALISAGAASSVLTLGVAAIGFAFVTRQLTEANDRLSRIEAVVDAIADYQRKETFAKFRTGTELAESAFRSNDLTKRQEQAKYLSRNNRYIFEKFML